MEEKGRISPLSRPPFEIGPERQKDKVKVGSGRLTSQLIVLTSSLVGSQCGMATLSAAAVPQEQSQQQQLIRQDRRKGQAVETKRKEQKRSESLGGALARSLVGSLAFFFRLPIRLFRPVKLSSWTVLESYAKRERKSLSLGYILQLIRRESRFFLFHLLGPPILFNTLIGFALFQGYTVAESKLLKKFRPEAIEESQSGAHWTPLWIVGISGGIAGAAQCLVSAPVDNVRLVLTSSRAPKKRRGHAGSAARNRISWRAVMRAAILPFAPTTRQHSKISKAMKDLQAKQQVNGSQSIAARIFDRQQQKIWQNKLRQLAGSAHGAGLLMSLVRDTVGFATFFFTFQLARRLAYGTSMSIDKSVAWFSTSSPLPAGMRSSSVETHDDEDRQDRYVAQAEPDFSYNTSRTKTGRVLAAVILVVGGAIGALCYEGVGRPFELMRVVIWQGRTRWQKERARQSRTARGGRSVRHLRAKNLSAAVQAAADTSTSRLESILTLRVANSAGTRISRIQAILSQSHPPHPLRNLGPHESKGKAGRQPSVKSASTKAAPPKVSSSPPSAISLLLKHAEKTSTLAYTSSSRKFRTTVPSSILLLHTYFIAPYLNPLVSLATPPGAQVHPTNTSDKPESSRDRSSANSSSTAQSAARLLSKWTNRNPVSASVALPSSSAAKIAAAAKKKASAGSSSGLSYLPPRPKAAPGSIATASAARQWGSGRAMWALRRLATPYSVGFAIFAWMDVR